MYNLQIGLTIFSEKPCIATRFGWDAELLLPKILTQVMLLCKRFGPVTQFAELSLSYKSQTSPLPLDTEQKK